MCGCTLLPVDAKELVPNGLGLSEQVSKQHDWRAKIGLLKNRKGGGRGEDVQGTLVGVAFVLGFCSSSLVDMLSDLLTLPLRRAVGDVGAEDFVRMLGTEKSSETSNFPPEEVLRALLPELSIVFVRAELTAEFVAELFDELLDEFVGEADDEEARKFFRELFREAGSSGDDDEVRFCCRRGVRGFFTNGSGATVSAQDSESEFDELEEPLVDIAFPCLKKHKTKSKNGEKQSHGVYIS